MRNSVDIVEIADVPGIPGSRESAGISSPGNGKYSTGGMRGMVNDLLSLYINVSGDHLDGDREDGDREGRHYMSGTLLDEM